MGVVLELPKGRERNRDCPTRSVVETSARCSRITTVTLQDSGHAKKAQVLHKLGKLITSNAGVILDYNTDAINCVFEGNKFPFELVEEIQLNNHYWDSDNKVYSIKLDTIK